MSEEIQVLAQVCSVETLARLNVQFRAIGCQLLTPELEPRISNGLVYRELLAQGGTGYEVYESLLKNQGHRMALIHHCASFTDLWFFAQFPMYIPLSWYGKRVCGWKTCFGIGNPSQEVVPYLDCTDTSALPQQSPRIRFHYLCEFLGENNYAAMKIGLRS